MRNIKYIVYKEDNYYVTKCLNFELSTFGESLEEAHQNMKEALELYFEDDLNPEYIPIDSVQISEMRI